MKGFVETIRLARAAPARAAVVAGLLSSLALASPAWSGSVLLSDSSLVTGNQSNVFSFDAPGPGTVSVQLTNIDWPQPLASLSFVAATGSKVLASWSDPASQSQGNLTFQVPGGGRYFADISATAAGGLDLGVYSFTIQFSPATTGVPLGASGGFLLCGLLLLLGLSLGHRLPLPAAAPEGLLPR